MTKVPIQDLQAALKDIARLMVQNQLSFVQAVKELKLALEGYECDVLQKRADWKKTLREAKNAFHADVANTPGRNKSSAIGMMQVAIENLMAEGEYDKAVSAIEKLAKLEGWVGSDSNINIFAGLTAREIAEQKAKVLEEINGNKNESRPN